MTVLHNLSKLQSNPLVLAALIMLLANNLDLNVKLDDKKLMLGLGAVLVYLHVTNHPDHEGFTNKLTEVNENDSSEVKKLKDSLQRSWMKNSIQANMLREKFCGN